MKSGLALMLDLAERGERPRVDLTLVFYAREEGPFAENELGPVLAQDPEVVRASLAIALEPSDNKLQLGCGGSLHATVTFHGRTAHSARPWQGENAVHKAAGLLARLGSLAPRAEVIDGFEWKNVVSATLATGGRARNVIPDRFELNLNHRFGPQTSLEDAQQFVRDLVAGEAELTFTDLSPSAPPNRHHPFIAALAESGVLAVEPKQAWTDVARFHAAGVPAANFGPGTQAQAHQRNEWTLVSGLATGRDILARWLTKVAGAAALASVLALSGASAACNDVAGTSGRRSDAVRDATPNGPSFFERSELRRWRNELGTRVGANARVLALDVREHAVTAQVEDSARPGDVLEYELESDKPIEPRRAELRGSGELATNLFTLADVALERIPELATLARTQIDAEAGKVVRVLVRRQLPHTDAVRFRVYVDSPRLSGHVDFDASGNPLAPGARAEL
jgi:succinyl-diaminopimelate desuccinylase